MPKRMFLKVLILALVSLMVMPSYVFLASSASGTIKVNNKFISASGQQIQAGGNINLYFGQVSWEIGSTEFYLLMSNDNYQQVSIPDIIYTPRFAISDLLDPSTTKTYTSGIGAWTVGSNWINGTIAQNIAVGNYSIKAFDEVSGTVAVTDVYIMVYSVIYSSELHISPASGPGGVAAHFAGGGFPPASVVTVTYFDSKFGSWNALATAVANAQGNITFTTEIPDLRRALGPGDYPEAYQRLSYRAEIHGIVYCYADYAQYSRGLKRVGNQTASGLFGNGTNLASSVNVVAGDNLVLSGKWFRPGDVIYIKWDGVAVVGTAFGNQESAVTIGTTIANSVGSFETSVPIPSANTGDHYVSIEDSQARVIVRIHETTQTLYLSPSSGPGGATVLFTGSRYTPNSPVILSYRDPQYGSWTQLTTVTSDAQGRIQYEAEMPDLKKSLTAYDSYESYSTVSFQTEQGGLVCCTTDYMEYSRGIKRIGSQTAIGLYGNGTNLAPSVRVEAGDILSIAGKWFHAGDVVYIKWDGAAVVGTVTGDQWRNALVIGSSIANESGYFSANLAIPNASYGEHYISVEDSQAKVILKILFVSESPPPSQRLPSNINLNCRSTTTYIGYTVEINGMLTSNLTAIPGAPIELSCSANGGVSWDHLTEAYTSFNGSFKAVWMPSVSGTYLINATYAGNFVYNGTNKIVTLASAPYASQNVFAVTSNSTVTALSFNSTSNQLSFAVTGEGGTKGFVEVSLAKSITANISSLKVYLDGVNMQYTTTSVADSWLIRFNYNHSTHNVMVEFGELIAPSPEPTPTPTQAPTQAPTTQPTSNPTNPPATPEPTTSISPSPQATSTPAIPEIPSIAPVLILIVASSIVFVLVKKRRQRT